VVLLPIPQQGKWLGHVVRGYFNYHAVPMNFRSLAVYTKTARIRALNDELRLPAAASQASSNGIAHSQM
jgi:hypothetical protein